MKSADKIFGILSVWTLAGLCLCLLSGCASSPTQSRKVYDRYAELVAARTRAAPPSASKAAETTDRKSTKDTAKPAQSARGDSTAKAVPAAKAEPMVPPAPILPPAVVIAPSAAEISAPKPSAPAALPDPVPALKPEAPVPAEPASPSPAPVQPPPVQVIEPSPAPAAPVPAQPVPAPSVPVAAAVPAPIPAPEAPPPPAPAAVANPVAASSTDGVAYLLKVGDVIQIFLRGIPSSDALEDVIDENGNVSLPLINEVRAAGMTAAELERNIRKTYLEQDIYRNIAVTVVVPTRYYFIQGEIRGPGRFQLVSATRVSQAIAGAGGYTEYASGQVVVKRGGKIVKTIRNAKRLERTPDDDILLEPDDIIEVRRSLW